MVRCTPSKYSQKIPWRGARVAESTCLESTRPGNGTVGSNPTLSAKFGSIRRHRLSRNRQWRASRTSRQRTMQVVKRYRTAQRSFQRRRREATPLPESIAVAGGYVWRGTARNWSSECVCRAQKRSDKGLGPVQQAPVNPARSGRKQR